MHMPLEGKLKILKIIPRGYFRTFGGLSLGSIVERVPHKLGSAKRKEVKIFKCSNLNKS
jgi:hypothetical protein